MTAVTAATLETLVREADRLNGDDFDTVGTQLHLLFAADHTPIGPWLRAVAAARPESGFGFALSEATDTFAAIPLAGFHYPGPLTLIDHPAELLWRLRALPGVDACAISYHGWSHRMKPKCRCRSLEHPMPSQCPKRVSIRLIHAAAVTTGAELTAERFERDELELHSRDRRVAGRVHDAWAMYVARLRAHSATA